MICTFAAILESAEVGNDHRNDFMINLHESYVTELGFEHAILWSVVRRVTTREWCIMRNAQKGSLCYLRNVRKSPLCDKRTAKAETSMRINATLSEHSLFIDIFSRTSIARTCLGPKKFVRDMGSSSHWGLIMTPDQEANSNNWGKSLIFCTISGVLIRIASMRRF